MYTRRMLLAPLPLLLAAALVPAGDWARFRGPEGAGIATDKGVPVKWGETDAPFKARVPGGYVRLQFTSAAALDAAARAHPTATRDDEALTLTLPSDGTGRSLRGALGVLDATLDRAGDAVSDVALHTPDLDDVFLALTGHPATPPAAADALEKEPAR